MNYQLYIPGEPVTRFNTETEAVEAAERALRRQPNADLQIIDRATGHPVEDRTWRTRLRRKIGY